MAEAGDRRPGTEGPILPEEARRELGRALRSSLDADADRPAYLGDPVTPPEFEDQVARLRSRLTARAEGPAAVEDALTDPLKPGSTFAPVSDRLRRRPLRRACG